MKITLLIGSLSGGGAERVTCNLANFLTRKGHDITVLTLSDKKTYFLDDKVQHVALYDKSNTHLPHFAVTAIRMLKLNRYLRKARPDVYVTFAPKLTKALLMHRRLVKCPIILAERNDPKTLHEGTSQAIRDFDKYYPLADGYVLQTDFARDYYAARGISMENAVVIPNAVNPEFIQEPYTGPRNKLIVGAGRLAKQKNFAALIKAFAKIRHKYPEHKLVIYGEGALRQELTDLCEALGVLKEVHLAGRVNNLDEKMKKSALFVLSSYFEGMPNVLAEAMALGVPCVSVDCDGGGARFLIQDGENGLLVTERKVSALAEAMDRVLSDEALAEKLGANARKLQQTLAPEKIYSQWEAFITQTASKS